MLRSKQLIAAMLSLSIAALSTFAFAADGTESAPVDYVFYLSFDESGTGSGSYEAECGGEVKEYGDIAYSPGAEGNALEIGTKSAENYLELPDGILEGCEAATYSFYLKPGSAETPNWPFMTTPEDSHAVNSEKYIGMLATTQAYTVERYNNTTERISAVSASGDYSDWKYVTVVAEENGTRVYINGILAASDSKTVDVAALFTADSKTWIGHANWGDGEGFAGMIDEFKLYGRALSEYEIQLLAGKAYQDEMNAYLNENNRLVIDTDFYIGSEKVFQLDGSAVEVSSEITNLRPETVTVTVKAIPYSSDGTAGDEVSQEYTIEPTKTAEFKGAVPEGAEHIEVVVSDGMNEYNGGMIYTSDVAFPDASPADSSDTTEGVHDPTIFKDPASGRYYVYSTHNLVFESDDLISWKKNDYTQKITIPEKAREFIEKNYADTTPNETYWAPDIYYAEGDEYPYWFHRSVSCWPGGRNSVLELVTPTSPGLWDGDYIDCGVVLASVESKDYNTNAIDANIYTDTDGITYFIWGSFWRGIHAAELITEGEDAGKIKGIDYTSDETILESGKSFGTRLFATPNGVQGPEGPYTIYNEDTGYRYMFTSYGWLGTNYNIRVARTDKTFAEILSGADPHKQLLDFQNRPVGSTYTEQENKNELWGYKVSGSFQLGDGIEYLGSGHNSVFKDDDGSWYLVQHCRKVADAVAYLQVKKLFWTSDGWPVISPLVYAGETEQAIPEQMLYGTWDLASVGQTIFADGINDVSVSAAVKKVDMPVHSSEIIIQPDGTLGDGLGSWSYDGDHTITLSFAKDGEGEYEFYKAGDTMELLALTCYDKDERESAIVMTGKDQNGITQFAKKSSAAAESTKNAAVLPQITNAVLNGTGVSVTTTGFTGMRMIAAAYSGGNLTAVSDFVNEAESAAQIQLDIDTSGADTVKIYIFSGADELSATPVSTTVQ